MQKVVQFFLVFSICINVSSQNARIVIDIRSDVFCEKGTMVYFNRSDMDESGIGFKKITAKKGITNTFISCSEPFYCYLEIRKGDSVLSSSSSFLITNSVIKVEFDMNKKLPVISGGENDYFFKNRFLLFDIPASIMRYPGFSIKKIKEDYDFQSDDIRLKFYFNEYQDNIVSIVKSKRNYYVVLQALWNKVEYMTLKTLETCYDLFTDTLKRTRLGKTLVSSPSDGTAGKIYFRQGSLVSPSTKDPLTIISKNDQMYAYFAITERDVLEFQEYYDGKTMRESIARIPEVRLLLPNGQLYPYGGKIDATTGLINSQTGTINLRARFPNSGGMLRSGNSGTVRIPDFTNNAVMIPQKSTYDIQDKTFVFVVNSDSTVESKPVTVWDISGNFYIIEKGLSPGERIVYEGTGRLRDGMKIIPETVSLDSLIEADKETITVKETN